MNPKLLILGLILMIGICGVYGMDITSSGVYVVGSDINENEDVNIKADNVAIIGDNKQIGIVFIKKSDLKNITIIDLTIKELSIYNYDNNRINLNNVAISGGKYGIYIDRSNNNKISGNISKVYGGQYGIRIYKGNNNIIEGVNGEIYGKNYGIQIYNSKDNKISGNISKVYGGRYGIYIYSGNNNIIEGVNGEIYGKNYGIQIYNSKDNKISGNISKVYGGRYGIRIYNGKNNKISGADYIPSSGGEGTRNLIYHCKIYGNTYSVHSNSPLTTYYNYIDNKIYYTKGDLVYSKSEVEYYLNETAYLDGETDLFKVIIPKEDAERYYINISELKEFNNYMGNQYRGLTGNDTNCDGIIDDKWYSSIDKYPLIGKPHKFIDLSLKDITIDDTLIKDGTYYLIGLNKTYKINLIIGHSGASVSDAGVELTANTTLVGTESVSFNENEDEKTLTLYWTPTDYGPYTLKGVVDYNNSVDETNEDNNTYEITVKVIDISIDFNYTPKNPKVNQAVDFTPIIKINGTDSSDLGEINLTWDFGDGSSELLDKYPNHATHKYSEVKDYGYLVSLTANSELGWSDSVSHLITISEKTDYHPIAKFTFSTDGTTVYFNASESYDIDGKIVKYIWDFGDGTNDSSSNHTINHTYSEKGRVYTVKLIVIDDDGYTGDTIRFVDILGENKSVPLPPYVNILLVIITMISITYIMRGFK